MAIDSGRATNSSDINLVSGNGTAGSPDAGVVSVQGVVSGIPVPVNATGTTASVAWTNATADNTALTVVNNSFAYSTVSVALNISGTLSTAIVYFERSNDGSTWFTAAVSQLNQTFGFPVINNYTGGFVFSGTNIDYQFEVAIQGWQYLRIRLHPVLSGAGTLNVVCAVQSVPKGVFVENNLTSWIIQGGVVVSSINPLAVQGNQQNNNAAPGSTNVGVLPALCNTSAPTWTDGKQTLLSVDTSGNLRVTGGGGGTQYTGSPAVGSSAIVTTAASGYDGANVRPLLISNTGQLHAIIDSATLGTVTVSGTLTTNADTTIGGTTTPSKGLLIIGKTNDGTPQYQPLPLNAGGAAVLVSLAGTGANSTAVKVDGSAVTQPVSGTVTINAIPAGSNTIGSVKVTDGTNTAKILAGSTAPAAGDTALEVAINPLSQGQGLGFIVDSTGVQRTIKIATFSTSSSGVTSVVSAVAAQKIFVLSWKVSSNGATNVNLQSHTTTTNTSGQDFFLANQGAVYPFDEGTWITTTSGEGLDVNNSAALLIAGCVKYVQF